MTPVPLRCPREWRFRTSRRTAWLFARRLAMKMLVASPSPSMPHLEGVIWRRVCGGWNHVFLRQGERVNACFVTRTCSCHMSHALVDVKSCWAGKVCWTHWRYDPSRQSSSSSLDEVAARRLRSFDEIDFYIHIIYTWYFVFHLYKRVIYHAFT